MVPKNKLQQRLETIHHETLSPGTGTTHVAYGTILEVYDQEYMATGTLPILVQNTIDSLPGLLFAKVKLSSGQSFVLPFRDSEDLIYSTYGNGTQLQGKDVRIEYQGLFIDKGHLVPRCSYKSKQIHIPQATYIYDIGGIV